MINRKQIEDAWKTYLNLYNAYVEQLKESKHRYTEKSCPLCDMHDKSLALDPEVKDSFGRICPLCKREEYWAF